MLLVLVCHSDWGDTIISNFPTIYIRYLICRKRYLIFDINKISYMIHKLSNI